MPAKISTSPAIQRRLRRLGEQLKEARIRRQLPQNLIAERAGLSRPTLSRAEKGDPSVSIGSYAAIIQALGLLEGWAEIDDPLGRALALEQLPKRVRGQPRPTR